MHVVVYNVISLKQTKNPQTNKQTNKTQTNIHIGSLKKNTKIIKRIIDISLNVTCMDHQIKDDYK